MASRHPSDRSTIAQIAALERWSKCDPIEGTAKARARFLAKFDDEVDPDRVLDPAERARRADRARRAYFQRMALRSAQARRKDGPDAA